MEASSSKVPVAVQVAPTPALNSGFDSTQNGDDGGLALAAFFQDGRPDVEGRVEGGIVGGRLFGTVFQSGHGAGAAVYQDDVVSGRLCLQGDGQQAGHAS